MTMMSRHKQVCSRVGFGSWSGLHHTKFTPLSDGTVIQFGVAGGKTLPRLVQIYGGRVFGFDTFTGLPPPEATDETTTSDWTPGRFSAGGKRMTDVIRRRAQNAREGSNVTLVAGEGPPV